MCSTIIACTTLLILTTRSQQNTPNPILSTHNPTLESTIEPTTAEPTLSPTNEGCSANYAFVFVESSSKNFSNTVTSLRTNYKPYTYPYTIINRKLVLFADGADMTDYANNPCNITTWTHLKTFYDGKVVMIEYNNYFISQCSAQQWSVNLNNYANILAILVANDKDGTHVFPLPGSNQYSDPTIPTRMISQISSENILNEMKNGNEIFVSIDCFNLTYPTVICVLDNSMTGTNAKLDGEYQQLSNVISNGHPVWGKEGMNILWDNYYIWLTVNHSSDTPWKWVIGTYPTIVAECILNSEKYIDNPTECGYNWYDVNGTLINNLTSNGAICDLADIYVCTSSGSTLFNKHFAGRYRQVHDGTTVWLGDNLKADAFITIFYIDSDFVKGYSFVFAYASTGHIFAFCPISDTLPTRKELLQPWDCSANWFVITSINGQLWWVNDPLMDIDRCYHPHAPPNATETPIVYPTALCLMDPTYKYSQYQTYYGIYILDNSTVYDNRSVYYNQRLLGTHSEWYFLWYEEKDSWILNNLIPTVTYVSKFEGICRDDVNTPDKCTDCWEFYHGIGEEINCNVTVFAMNSTNEKNCVSTPINNIISYTLYLTLCFDDGISDIYANVYTGKWYLQSNDTYNNRSFWYKENVITGRIDYYIYYDETWRFWVIASRFTVNENLFLLSCLHWDEFEPFNCHTWYTNSGSIVTMNANCSLPPTLNPSLSPTLSPFQTPTSPPSISPTLKPSNANTYSPTIETTYIPSVHVSTKHTISPTMSLSKTTSSTENAKDELGIDASQRNSYIEWVIGVSAVLLLCLLCCFVSFYCYQRKKGQNVKKRTGHSIVAADSSDEEVIETNTIEMGTDNTKGEMIQIDNLDNENADEQGLMEQDINVTANETLYDNKQTKRQHGNNLFEDSDDENDNSPFLNLLQEDQDKETQHWVKFHE